MTLYKCPLCGKFLNNKKRFYKCSSCGRIFGSKSLKGHEVKR